MPDRARCPDNDRLTSWIESSLASADDRDLEQHIRECSCCQEFVAEIGKQQEPLIRELQGLELEPTRSRFCRDAIIAIRRFIEESRQGSAAESPTELRLVKSDHVGPYRLLSELGRGGMGRVFLVRSPESDSPLLALKLLQGDTLRRRSGRARFAREAKYALSLHHPNLVRAIDTGFWNAAPFLVMEYLPGVSVSELVQRHGPLSVETACEIVRQAALGLGAVHEAGLVHRDVKPSNLVLTSGCLVKVLDLGLARITDVDQLSQEVTATGQFLGTVAFVAPEQLVNPKNIDQRADIYSLACTLFCLLSGRPPYSGPDYETAWQIASAHTADEVPLLSEQRPDVPNKLGVLLQTAMSPRPEARPQSMREFAEAVDRWAAMDGLQAILPESSTGSISEESPATFTLSVPANDGTDDSAEDTPAARRRVTPGTAFLLLAGLLAATAFAVPRLFQWGPYPRSGSSDSGSNADRITAKPPGTAESSNSVGEQTAAEFVWQKPLFALKEPAEEIADSAMDGKSDQMGLTPRSMDPVAGEGHTRSWVLETRRPRADLWRSAFSSDGRCYAVGGNSGIVRVYEAETDRTLRILAGEAPVTALDWSPAGPWLLVGAANGSVTIWDLPRARRLHRFEHETGHVTSAGWSPDGNRIAFSGNDQVTVVRSVVDDFATEFRSPPGHSTKAIAWAPDSKRLAVTDRSLSVRIWNCETLLQEAVIEHGGPTALQVAWSNDGRWLAACCDDSSVSIVDVQAREVVKRLTGHQQSFLNQAVWLPGDAGLLINDGVFLHMYDQRTFERIERIGNPLGETHSRYGGSIISRIAVSPNGGTLVCPLRYRRDVWRVDWTVDPPRTWLAHGSTRLPCIERKLELSPDRRLAAVSDAAAGLWIQDLTTGQLLAPPTGIPTHQTAWSPDGTNLAVADYESLKLFDVKLFADGTRLHLRSTAKNSCYSCRWSPDGTMLAVGGFRPGFLKLVDPDDWSERLLSEISSPVFSIAWSPDSSRVAVGTLAEVLLFDVPTRQPLRSIRLKRQVFSLAWHPAEPLIAAVGTYGRVYLINADTGEFSEIGVHRSNQGSAVWSADGTLLITGTDESLIGWSYPERRQLWSLPNDGVQGSSLALGPDDQSLLAASNTGLKVIDLESLRTKRTYLMFEDGENAVIDESGIWTGSPGVSDKLLYVVDTRDGQELLTPDEFAKRQQ